MSGKAQRAKPDRSSTDESDDNAVLSSLSPTERAKLDIDAWEPSLLRALLEAQDKLSRDRG